MKNKSDCSCWSLGALVLAIGLLFVVVGCKRQDAPKPPPPPPPAPAPVTQTRPAELEVPIPPFNEDAYVEIAAYVDFLRDSIKDEDKVATELIKYIKKFGFNVKDQSELESAMIEMSNQLLTKTKDYRDQVEQKVRDRLDEMRKAELQRLSKEANEQPPMPEKKPAEQKPVTPTEQPK